MLLWELAFEKFPYEHWDTNKIIEHVLANKREKITFVGKVLIFKISKKTMRKLSFLVRDPSIYNFFVF